MDTSNGAQTGSFTIEQLQKTGLFVSGKYIAIKKNDILTQYLVVGSGTQTKLVDISNHSYLQGPQLEAFLNDPQKITVRELDPAEKANLKSFSPEYKTQQEFNRSLKNNPEVKGVRYFEADVIATNRRSAGGGQPEIPAIVYSELREKVRYKTLNEHTLDTTEEVVKNKKRTAIIKRDEVKNLYEELQQKGINSNNINDYKKVNAVVTDSVQKEIKSLFQSAAKSSGTDWFSLMGKASGQELKIDINKNLSGTEFSDIHIVDDVVKKNETLLEAFNEQKKENTKKDLVTNKKVKINTTEFTRGLLENLPKKDFDVYSVEARADSIKRMGLESEYNKIQGDILHEVRGFEKLHGGNLSKSSAAQHINLVEKATTYDGTKTLANVNTDYSLGADRKINEFSKTVEELRSLEAGEGVSKDGTVRAINPKEVYKRKVIAGTKDTLYKTIASEQDINNPLIRKKINDYVGELHYSDTFSKSGNYQRLPKQVTQKTGLLRTVSSLVGTYFYQGMLHSSYRKVESFFSNAIEPGEIIEAKKHSSAETSTRRLLTTDFGSKFTDIGIILKDVLIGGRTSSQVFQKVKNNDTFRTMVSMVRQSDIRRENIEKIGAETKRFYKDTRNYVKTLPQKMKQNVAQSFDYIKDHPKATMISTGTALFVTNFGSSKEETSDEKLIKKRRKNTTQKEYLNNNKVYSSDFFHSDIYIQKASLSGFGSKFDGMRSLIKLSRLARPEGEIVNGIQKYSETHLIEKIKSGFTFNKLDNTKLESSLAYSKSMSVRNSALSLKEESKNQIHKELRNMDTLNASTVLFDIKDRRPLMALNKYTSESMQEIGARKETLNDTIPHFDLKKKKLPETFSKMSYIKKINLPENEKLITDSKKIKTSLEIQKENHSFYNTPGTGKVIQDTPLMATQTSKLKNYKKTSIVNVTNSKKELVTGITQQNIEPRIMFQNLNSGGELNKSVYSSMPKNNFISKQTIDNINSVSMDTNKINRAKKFGDSNRRVLNYG